MLWKQVKGVSQKWNVAAHSPPTLPPDLDAATS